MGVQLRDGLAAELEVARCDWLWLFGRLSTLERAYLFSATSSADYGEIMELRVELSSCESVLGRLRVELLAACTSSSAA